MPDSPAAPDRSLQAQPAVEDLRNALQIALSWELDESSDAFPGDFAVGDFAAVARLLRAALAKLDGASGPPNKQEPL